MTETEITDLIERVASTFEIAPDRTMADAIAYYRNDKTVSEAKESIRVFAAFCAHDIVNA